MDLREYDKGMSQRHPWELARIDACRMILGHYNVFREGMTVLDIGCGDGFGVVTLLKDTLHASIDAIDTSLTASLQKELSVKSPDVNFHRTYDTIPRDHSSLITLLDVLEHVENDIEFLKEIIEKYADQKTFFLITVPAFQRLFGPHDKFLGHKRRYSLQELQEVLRKSGLHCLGSGFLFGALLPLRVMSNILYTGGDIPDEREQGVANWNHGRLLSKSIQWIMDIDNRILLLLNKVGIKLPGLSVWGLCRKR